MTKLTIRRVLLASACSIALSAPAYAQEANDENSGEIVVTAQNREQNVQDVPICSRRASVDRLEEEGRR